MFAWRLASRRNLCLQMARWHGADGETNSFSMLVIIGFFVFSLHQGVSQRLISKYKET